MITYPTDPTVQRLQYHYGVVHFGRRDQYQVAVSLAEIGALERLFTDFYTPGWLLAVLEQTVPGLAQRFRSRYDPDLSDRLTTSLLLQFLRISYWQARRLTPELVQEALGDLGSEYAARYVTQHRQVGMVSYSYHWKALSASAGYRAMGRAGDRFPGPSCRTTGLLHPERRQIKNGALVFAGSRRTSIRDSRGRIRSIAAIC